jgi:hypothetical protein
MISAIFLGSSLWFFTRLIMRFLSLPGVAKRVDQRQGNFFLFNIDAKGLAHIIGTKIKHIILYLKSNTDVLAKLAHFFYGPSSLAPADAAPHAQQAAISEAVFWRITS